MKKFVLGYLGLVLVSFWLLSLFSLLPIPTAPINWPISLSLLSLLIIPTAINFRYNQRRFYACIACSVAAGLGFFWHSSINDLGGEPVFKNALNVLCWAGAALLCWKFNQSQMFYIGCAKFVFGVITLAVLGPYRGIETPIYWAIVDNILYVAILVPPTVQSWRFVGGGTETKASSQSECREHKAAA